MSHRAEQIIDAIAEAIRGSSWSGAVFTHRAGSLSESDAELPAVSVDFGEDSPAADDGASNFAYVDSMLAVETTVYVRDTHEESVRTSLLDARRAIHVALMADRSLGLSFVIDTRYGGADRPEINTDAEYVEGSLVCRWTIHYRMNITDPS